MAPPPAASPGRSLRPPPRACIRAASFRLRSTPRWGTTHASSRVPCHQWSSRERAADPQRGRPRALPPSLTTTHRTLERLYPGECRDLLGGIGQRLSLGSLSLPLSRNPAAPPHQMPSYGLSGSAAYSDPLSRRRHKGAVAPGERVDSSHGPTRVRRRSCLAVAWHIAGVDRFCRGRSRQNRHPRQHRVVESLELGGKLWRLAAVDELRRRVASAAARHRQHGDQCDQPARRRRRRTDRRGTFASRFPSPMPRLSPPRSGRCCRRCWPGR